MVDDSQVHSPGREKTAKLATGEELMTSALVVRMHQANGTKYNPWYRSNDKSGMYEPEVPTGLPSN